MANMDERQQGEAKATKALQALEDARKKAHKLLLDRLLTSKYLDNDTISTAIRIMFEPVLGKPGEKTWDVSYSDALRIKVANEHGELATRWSSIGKKSRSPNNMMTLLQDLANNQISMQDKEKLDTISNELDHSINKALSLSLEKLEELKTLQMQSPSWTETQKQEGIKNIERKIALATFGMMIPVITVCIFLVIGFVVGAPIGAISGAGALFFGLTTTGATGAVGILILGCLDLMNVLDREPTTLGHFKNRQHGMEELQKAEVDLENFRKDMPKKQESYKEKIEQELNTLLPPSRS